MITRHHENVHGRIFYDISPGIDHLHNDSMYMNLVIASSGEKIKMLAS